MKGNTVVGENGITARLHNISSAKFDWEDKNKLFTRHKVNMVNLEADGYYLMHNHPSKDNHKPSKGDIDTTELFINNLPGFKGHIITSNSGASIINKDLSINEISSGKPESIELINGTELVNIAKEYNTDERITLIYVNNDAELVAIQTADTFELKNVDQFQDTIFNFKRKFGASGLYLIVYNKEQLDLTSIYISTIFEVVNAIIYIDYKNRRFKTYTKNDFSGTAKVIKGIKKSGTFKKD